MQLDEYSVMVNKKYLFSFRVFLAQLCSTLGEGCTIIDFDDDELLDSIGVSALVMPFAVTIMISRVSRIGIVFFDVCIILSALVFVSYLINDMKLFF